MFDCPLPDPALFRPESVDQETTEFNEDIHFATVSVDYRLAPENPFPAGLDDCEAAAVYGAYDLSGTPRARNWGEERKLILTSRTMEWFHENYAPKGKWCDPEVSPLYADLKGLPRALFTVGTLDPLRDDSLFMCSRWVAAGSEAELALYPGGIHGFNLFPIKLAQEANGRIGDFIKERVTG